MEDVTDSLNDAVRLMEMALRFIDEADQATDAGAHLDLAIQRLKRFIGTKLAA